MTEHHLEFLSLTGGCTGWSESTLSKSHIVGNHMSRLNNFQSTFIFSHLQATSKLLVSYPEPYRSQILDYLFKVYNPFETNAILHQAT